MGYKRFGCIGKIMKLVTYFFFLSPSTYNLLFVGYSGWKGMNDRKEIFQTQLLFSGL